MKILLIRLVNLVFGLFLFALGIAMSIRANIGYAPWDVLHAGLSKRSGLSIGIASILVGILILVVLRIFGEKIGLGTIANMVLVGLFLDAILIFDLIPLPQKLHISIIMLISGLFIIAIGTYLYIKSAFSSGPRDSLMVVLSRKTKLPIGLCRGSIELLVLLGGWALGGMAGLGTVISVLSIGFCVQIVFKIFRFDATKVKHETFADTINTFAAARKAR
jgi:uncharacterized membrane protein YczE